MSEFKKHKIVIPKEVWKLDWEAALADRTDEEKRIIRLQKRLTELLKGLPTESASPERVAWMIFWTRSFVASMDARTALEAGSEHMLTILKRMCFEMEMQMNLIMEPLSRKKSFGMDATWRDLMSRFRGYTAWCLWADKSFLEELARPKSMESACDTSTARKLLEDPVQREILEEFGGADEAYRVAQEVNRAELEKGLRTQLRDVRGLLNDDSLIEWVSKLKKPGSHLTFFELLSENERTMRRRLTGIGLPFAYSIYMEGSMGIHGNSFDQFFHKTDGNWHPRLAPVGKHWMRPATEIAGHLEGICLGLLSTKGQIWKAVSSE